VSELSPQIPFELFEPEPPSFENFLVGDNEELLTQLYANAGNAQLSGATSVWGGRSVGKTHLLKAFFSAISTKFDGALLFGAEHSLPESPFVETKFIAADDVDQFDIERQAWLFNAFNHVVPRGGAILVSGATSPALWPIREDLRTRLASGLVFEIQPVPQDALPALLADYAKSRGTAINDEVIAYILSRTERATGALCQLISAIDRLSLSLKRPITVPLVRAYLTQHSEKVPIKER
jgi:DnaA-homolog protein